jgi:hypothetical protein
MPAKAQMQDRGLHLLAEPVPAAPGGDVLYIEASLLPGDKGCRSPVSSVT